MPKVRFNHMELTVPPGALDATMRAELTAFYGGVLGWESIRSGDSAIRVVHCHHDGAV